MRKFALFYFAGRSFFIALSYCTIYQASILVTNYRHDSAKKAQMPVAASHNIFWPNPEKSLIMKVPVTENVLNELKKLSRYCGSSYGYSYGYPSSSYSSYRPSSSYSSGYSRWASASISYTVTLALILVHNCTVYSKFRLTGHHFQGGIWINWWNNFNGLFLFLRSNLLLVTSSCSRTLTFF